ncbi:AzlD domain-containing protein [Acetivibrio sp. MSJd-27]|jgi:branched-chain amino acid transport protein|uniref:AzlD domain-containing protein n=1 Tax=Acetivibrio sp. MSJd-27 TaxID=2841523 RepID=UPI0015A7A1A5|nr:AzlD domain-containing protein [Acetivibrio sp. MSJd-27]MBU5449305.1 AzlD domain-containing protein [Acetivibrio sp. MSJd-27]
MSNFKIYAAVSVMALTTYLIRMLPITLFKKRITNIYIRSFLSYVPFTVLGAMTFPAIFYATGNTVSAGIGFIVALLLAWKKKGLLTVSLASAAAVFLVEQVLHLLSL